MLLEAYEAIDLDKWKSISRGTGNTHQASVLKTVCQVSHKTSPNPDGATYQGFPSDCLAAMNITVLDKMILYPLGPTDSWKYFSSKWTVDILKMVKDSKSWLVHYYSSHTRKYLNSALTAAVPTAFELLALEHCPQTYHVWKTMITSQMSS
ncbi:unnamed protein product [Notodromas monacha]|uniref:Alpha 1,4-glycosyltransferase domain-containing protein n=1 Tax=Notodromas monacha TaxID=399045 RepID=A0A7R9BTZ7_9CRUS|nr:unnamed protein product [Notodromas monacha]CAG0920700.1 unnamed protein product [Notodromas monacha]